MPHIWYFRNFHSELNFLLANRRCFHIWLCRVQLNHYYIKCSCSCHQTILLNNKSSAYKCWHCTDIFQCIHVAWMCEIPFSKSILPTNFLVVSAFSTIYGWKWFVLVFFRLVCIFLHEKLLNFFFKKKLI